MNDFTASNGVIVREHPGAIGIRRSVEDLAPVAVPGFTKPDRVETYLDPRQWDAIAEAVQAEADERLGRWRWPENPQWVVYPDEDGDVVAMDESTGQSTSLLTRLTVGKFPNAEGCPAARAYFDAHPEQKPWHEAAPAEVWILMFRESSHAWFVNGDYFQSTKTLTNISKTDEGIIAGRRIYPDEVAS